MYTALRLTSRQYNHLEAGFLFLNIWRKAPAAGCQMFMVRGEYHFEQHEIGFSGTHEAINMAIDALNIEFKSMKPLHKAARV